MLKKRRGFDLKISLVVFLGLIIVATSVFLFRRLTREKIYAIKSVQTGKEIGRLRFAEGNRIVLLKIDEEHREEFEHIVQKINEEHYVHVPTTPPSEDVEKGILGTYYKEVKPTDSTFEAAVELFLRRRYEFTLDRL